MRVPDWMPVKSPIALALLAGSLLGLVAGLARPPGGLESGGGGEVSWHLPAQADLARSEEGWFTQVRRAAIWGDAGGMNGGGSAKRVTWRLAGIIAHPAPAALVVADGDPKPKSLKVGDLLPDGSRIIGLAADRVEFESDGCVQSRILYAQADTAGENACATAP